jgi:general secretion pathway protein C
MFANDELKSFLERPKTIKTICFVLAFLIIWQLVSFYSQIKYIKNISLSSYVKNEEHASRNNVNIKALLNLDLFGKFVPKLLDKANITPSTLDIHVIGILFSSQKNESQVILKFANGKENIFKIGDIIHGGASIVEIYRDKVIISRDGVLESVKFSNHKLIFDDPPKPLR